MNKKIIPILFSFGFAGCFQPGPVNPDLLNDLGKMNDTTISSGNDDKISFILLDAEKTELFSLHIRI